MYVVPTSAKKGLCRRSDVDKPLNSLGRKFQGDFLPSRKPSSARYAKTSAATQLTQDGTAQPPSNTDTLKTSRDRWPSAMSKKITLATRENVLCVMTHLSFAAIYGWASRLVLLGGGGVKKIVGSGGADLPFE